MVSSGLRKLRKLDCLFHMSARDTIKHAKSRGLTLTLSPEPFEVKMRLERSVGGWLFYNA